jgi:hypothetical protein
MTGLMQRILRRGDPSSDVSQPEAPEPEAAAPEPVPFPAGVDPDDQVAPVHPSFHHRGRMRRRLRYLRRARELGFRDLGGLVFDLRRFDRDRSDLVDAKVAALFEVDSELRALETALDDRRELHELREAGVASCPRCGALHGSEARFCPSCGTPLHGPQPIAEVGEALPAQLAGVGSPAVRPGAEPAAIPAPEAEPEEQVPVPRRRPGRVDEPAPFSATPEPESEPATDPADAPAPASAEETEPPTRAMRRARRDAARADAAREQAAADPPAEPETGGR